LQRDRLDLKVVLVKLSLDHLPVPGLARDLDAHRPSVVKPVRARVLADQPLQLPVRLRELSLLLQREGRPVERGVDVLVFRVFGDERNECSRGAVPILVFNLVAALPEDFHRLVFRVRALDEAIEFAQFLGGSAGHGVSGATPDQAARDHGR
jgi:hypothetical protein